MQKLFLLLLAGPLLWIPSSALSGESTASQDFTSPASRVYFRSPSRLSFLVFSSNGNSILTAESNSLYLWDTKRDPQRDPKKPLNRKLKGHPSCVSSGAFSPDGKTVVTGSFDSTACMWDVETGRKLRVLKHTSVVSSVAWSPDGKTILTGSWYGTAHVWDTKTGKLLKKFDGHDSIKAVYINEAPHSISSVAYSPKGDIVITVSEGGTTRLWNIRTGSLLKQLTGSTHDIASVAWSPDGATVVSGSWDGSVRLWNTTTGQQLKEFLGHTNKVSSVAFSPDGTTIITGSADKTIRLWDLATGQQKQLLKDVSAVLAVAFSPDGSKIFTGSDQKFAFWSRSRNDFA